MILSEISPYKTFMETLLKDPVKIQDSSHGSLKIEPGQFLVKAKNDDLMSRESQKKRAGYCAFTIHTELNYCSFDIFFAV